MVKQESTTSRRAREAAPVTPRAPYGTIPRNLWDEPGFLALPPAARALYVYLRTCPAATGIGAMVGVFRFHETDAQDHLGVSIESVISSMAALESSGRVRLYGRYVWIPSVLADNPSMRERNPKHRTAIAGYINALPVPALIADFAARYPDSLSVSAPQDQDQNHHHHHHHHQEGMRYRSDTVSDTVSDEPRTTPPPTDTTPQSESVAADDVMTAHDLWTQIPGKNRQPLTDKRRDAFKGAFASHRRDDVLDSLRWAKAHHKDIGDRKRGGKFDEPEELFRFPDDVKRRATEWRQDEKARQRREYLDPNILRLQRQLRERSSASGLTPPAGSEIDPSAVVQAAA